MVAHGPLAANPILWAKATLRRYRLPDQLRARILFGIAPGGACHAGPVASPGGLLLHRFTLTHADMGGFISVALSVGLPRPGVTRHHCFVESGLSSGKSPRPSSHPRVLCAYLDGGLRSTEIYWLALLQSRNRPRPVVLRPWGENAGERPAAAFLGGHQGHIQSDQGFIKHRRIHA